MGLNPIATATGQVTTSAIMLAPLALLVDRAWALPPPSIETWGALAGLAIFSTALAYILFFRILRSAGAANVMLVTLLVPVSAILLGVLALGEALEPEHIGGMALIAAGLVAIDGRLWKMLRPRRLPPSMRPDAKC